MLWDEGIITNLQNKANTLPLARQRRKRKASLRLPKREGVKKERDANEVSAIINVVHV